MHGNVNYSSSSSKSVKKNLPAMRRHPSSGYIPLERPPTVPHEQLPVDTVKSVHIGN